MIHSLSFRHRRRPQFCLPLIGVDLAILEHDAAAALGAHGRVVGDDDQGGAGVFVQVVEEIEDRRAGFGIEVARGLIGQEKQRIIHQRPRHGDALLLPAGKLDRPMVHAVLQSHQVAQLRGADARTFGGII